MQEVTKEEFYRAIYEGNLNVHPTVEGRYPFTSVFKFPSGRVFGKVVDREEIPGKVVSTYYVNKG